MKDKHVLQQLSKEPKTIIYHYNNYVSFKQHLKKKLILSRGLTQALFMCHDALIYFSFEKLLF